MRIKIYIYLTLSILVSSCAEPLSALKALSGFFSGFLSSFPTLCACSRTSVLIGATHDSTQVTKNRAHKKAPADHRGPEFEE